MSADFWVSTAPEGVLPGEAYLYDTPTLHAHAGTQPDLYLCWNAIPPRHAALDVVVHLHGFSRAGERMPLSEKVVTAGLDLARRGRPSLALVPRGNWLRHSWYDFPALRAGGLDRLVDYATARFASAAGVDRIGIGRLTVSAHSGGGMPAVDAIAEAGRHPDEFFVFDGLYGRDPAGGEPMRGLEDIDRWLEARLTAEPKRPGALRVVYIEQQTGPFSRQVQGLIDSRLGARDPAWATSIGRRYRVEPSGVPHAHIARRCLPELLSDPAANFDWSR